MKRRVKIKVDNATCGDPRGCVKCLNVCQPAVFTMPFKDKDQHDPQDWFISATFPQLCTNCNLCVEVCPKNAIKLKIKKKYVKQLYAKT